MYSRAPLSVLLLATALVACEGDDTTAPPDAGTSIDSGGTDGGPTPGDNPAFEVTSPDGTATLSVPAGALPLGVDPNEVSIRALTESSVTTDPPLELFAAYELSPDGLVFSTPLVLRIHRAVSDGALIAFLNSPSSGTLEMPPSASRPEEATSRAATPPSLSSSRHRETMPSACRARVRATAGSKRRPTDRPIFGSRAGSRQLARSGNPRRATSQQPR